MKLCLSCKSEFLNSAWKCKACNFKPKIINGIPQFSPSISGIGESYDPSWYDELAYLEKNNFWFVARNRLIHWLAKEHLPHYANYLEIGCGTGFVLQMLTNRFPHWNFIASEAQIRGIDFAKKRVSKKVHFIQMDACKIPFRKEFEVVGAFDVLEHIRDDLKAIKKINSALKSKSFFILSVPQHMFLWSQYDEFGCHFRRYSKNEIESKLRKSGFRILHSTSFNSLLLPIMAISRIFKQGTMYNNKNVLSELKIHPFTNLILSLILKLEFRFIRLGVNFAFGGSRMIVCQKLN